MTRLCHNFKKDMKNTNIPTEQFGIHLMFDGYGADPFKLKDADSLSKMLHNIPTAMGMHTISDPLVVEVGPKNRKDPGGLSGFVLIAESHLNMYTLDPVANNVTKD